MKRFLPCEISGIHNSEYEDYSLLGYGVMCSPRSRSVFQRCLLPASRWSGPDDGGSMHLWKICLLLWDYMGPYPRRLSSSDSYQFIQ
jgi:hypothetical protein